MQVAKQQQKIFNSNKKCITAKRNVEIIQQHGKTMKTNVRACRQKGTSKICRVYVNKETDMRKLLLRMTNLKY